MTVSVAWAAMAPPRGGWERVGAVAADEVYAVARQGIEEVASGAPADAGSAAVTALRRRVWGRLDDDDPAGACGRRLRGIRAGVQLLPGSEMTVWAHGRWTRLSTPAGHVLIR